ncbi:hypothetical protein J6590_082523 [Homalodisca vitripennis]|nr:hypothetical protein J6590_082523 [Homalodisca vitripennis]
MKEIQQGSLLAGLYLPVEPTTGTAKTVEPHKRGQTYVSRSGTANIEILSVSINRWCLASQDIRVCDHLPPLTGEAGSEGVFSSSEEAALTSNVTYPEYPVTSEAAQSNLGLWVSLLKMTRSRRLSQRTHHFRSKSFQSAVLAPGLSYYYSTCGVRGQVSWGKSYIRRLAADVRSLCPIQRSTCPIHLLGKIVSLKHVYILTKHRCNAAALSGTATIECER